MGVLFYIYKNLDHFRTRFLVVFFTGILDGIATFYIPVLLAEFTKQTFTVGKFQSLITYIIAFYIASLLLQWIIRRYGESLAQQFSNYMRIKYFRSLEKLPIKKLISHHSGYILSLINRVSDGLAPILFDIFWTIAKSISNLILFFYFTAKESFFIAFFNLIMLSAFVALSTILSRKMVPLADALNKKFAALFGSYSDFMSNILTVKRLGISAFVEHTLHKRTNESDKQIQKLQNFHANRWFFLHTLFGIAFLATISFLLFQVAKHGLAPSVLILFIAAYAVIRTNIEKLSEDFKTFLEIKTYMNNLENILSSKESVYGKRDVPVWQQISFDSVFFQYPGTEKSIAIPSFRIQKGEKVCLIGKSGEGKTTFLHLFANFLQPDKGKRFVDSNSYDEMNGMFFQKHMIMISQETELFNISLRENITLGQKIEEKTILEMLNKLDLLPWLNELADGLETIVGEKGIKLSAGQKQRINLLRGVLLNREIVLLDEPTSHLDPFTEKKVITFLSDYLANKTTIIVSHREAVKTLCNRYYVVKDHILIT